MTSSFCFDILLNFRTTYIDEVCGVPCRVVFFWQAFWVGGQVGGRTLKQRRINDKIRNCWLIWVLEPETS